MARRSRRRRPHRRESKKTAPKKAMDKGLTKKPERRKPAKVGKRSSPEAQAAEPKPVLKPKVSDKSPDLNEPVYW